MKTTSNAKRKRDQAIQRFAARHPHWTEKKIGEKFGLSQASISEILNRGINK